MKKTFDTNEMVRGIRDQINVKLENKTNDEIIAYFHKTSEEFRKQHPIGKKEFSIAATSDGYE